MGRTSRSRRPCARGEVLCAEPGRPHPCPAGHAGPAHEGRSRTMRQAGGTGVPSAGIALQRTSFLPVPHSLLASAASRLMAAECPSDTMRERHEIKFENVTHSSRYHDSGRFIGRADFLCTRRVGSAARASSFRDVVQRNSTKAFRSRHEIPTFFLVPPSRRRFLRTC